MADLSRRRLLLAGMAGAATLAAAPLVQGLFPGPPAVGRRVLDEEAMRIGELLARDFIGPGADRVPVLAAVDETLGALGGELARLWPLLPRLVEHTTVLEGQLGAYSTLSDAARAEVLAAWGASSIVLRRQVYRGLHDLLLAHYYFDPASWPDIGYQGPWLQRFSLPVNPPRFPVVVKR